MGKKGTSKWIELIKPNDKFNEWTVISEPVMGKVLCRCSCGFENNIDTYSLYHGASKRCWKCGYSKKMEENPAWKGYKEIPYGWFSKYFERKKGNKKQRTGDITIQDAHALWIFQDKKCALSGVLIGFYDDGKGHTCSIDRIDSLKEYTLDNIQLVHKDINIMKNKFDNQYFIKMCKLIANGGACEINI
jgi:hypothetical protein